MIASKTPEDSLDAPHILLVDDEPSSLLYLKACLKQCGYRFTSAPNITEAKKFIEALGSSQFDALLTDYHMPGGNGTDLLTWLFKEDSTLAAAVITAQGEKNVIAETLRLGASDFLEKPVKPDLIQKVVSKLCHVTSRRRSLNESHQVLESLSQLRGILCRIKKIPDFPPPTTLFLPKHQLGGDFIEIFPSGEKKYTLLCADGSGHDLKAAYLSAYFQGLVRGILEDCSHLESAIKYFNLLLTQEWQSQHNDSSQIGFSLSALFAELDCENETLTIFNCGFPNPAIFYTSGQIEQSDETSQPLGWFDQIHLSKTTLNTADIQSIYFFTDGMFDFADMLEINLFSLAYRLLQEKEPLEQEKLTDAALDDILLLHFHIAPPSDSNFTPLFHDRIFQDSTPEIDQLQTDWERSVSYALNLETITSKNDPLAPALLSCRELVLNSLTHATCNKKCNFCDVTIAYQKISKLLRITVEDCGTGHNFHPDDFAKEKLVIDKNQPDTHLSLGLPLVAGLADTLEFEKNGAKTIVLFKLEI